MPAKSKYKEKILQLRKEGKTYKEIQSLLGCSNSTIHYHIGGEEQKEKYVNRNRKFLKKQHPFYRKIKFFKSNKSSKYVQKYSERYKKYPNLRLTNKIRRFCSMDRTKRNENGALFTVEDVINKYGKYPKCYLTGKTINIYETSSYHFDHIQPLSRGGSNTLDNLGICTKEANRAKYDLNPKEFFDLCREILEHQGYKITKPSQK